MATEFIVTLKASGGDYSTLTTWENEIQTDLTAATAKVFSHGGKGGDTFANNDTLTGATSGATGNVVGVVTDTQVFLDGISGTFQSGELLENGADNITISDAGDSCIAVIEGSDFELTDTFQLHGGFGNADATNKFIIRAEAGAEHLGVKGAGFRVTSSGICFHILEFCDVFDVEISTTSTGASSMVGHGTNLSEYYRCIFTGDNLTGSSPVINGDGSFNWALYSCWITSTGRGVEARDLTKLFNCTITGTMDIGLVLISSNAVARNTVAMGGSSTDYTFAASPVFSYLASEDTTATGTGAVTSVSTTTGVDFTNPGTDDYSISDGDSVLAGAGSNSYNPTLDITRTAHNDPPEIGAWALVGGGGPDVLTPTNIESASEVSSPVVTQEHALTPTDVQSTSEVSAPAVGQVHAITPADIESSSEVSSPVLSSGHVLAANDVESASEVSIPSITQAHALVSTDVESASEVSATAIGQVHALAANDVESASEVSAPALQSADHSLTPDDVESASEVSAPAVGQGHTLIAVDVESASEVSGPALTQEHALVSTDVESASEVSAPVLAIDLKTVTCTLVARDGDALPNLTALSWAWFDAADPNVFIAPSDQGQIETTDGTGEIVVYIPDSTLTTGQTGTLVLRSDDGTSLGAYNLAVV